MSLQLQSQLMKPERLEPFSMADSLSPTFQDVPISFLKDSKQYFCTDPSVMIPSSNVKQQRQIPENIIQILSRQFQERTSVDNAIVYKFLSRCKFFRELSDKLSSEVTKYILRQGKPKLYTEGDLISSYGKRIKTIRILLHGEVGILSEEQRDEEIPDLWDILHQLVDKLGKESKSFKIKHTATANNKNHRQPLEHSQLFKRETLRHDLDLDNLRTIQPQTLLDFAPLAISQPRHRLTLVVTEPNTLLLNIGLDQFYQSLFLFYNLKQNQVIKLFRKVPIFNSFENPKLKVLIEKLKIVQRKKNEFIYKEKDAASCFYLLTEGEVEITKTIDLLAENPNNFYKNRVKVSRQKINLNIKILPYANFNGVYNYQNESKLVRLSLINPISVFGEEQLIQSTPRQVNAKVLSLTAKMYEINLTDIEQFCTKISGNQADKQKKMTIIDFFSIIQESITIKKILFRQNLLSEMVNHENKVKYKVLFESNQCKTESKGFRSVSRRRTASSGTPLNKSRHTQDEAPPTFNNFNFTDFMNEKEQEYQSLSPTFTPQESRIVKLTHSKFLEPDDSHNKKVKDKTIRLRHVSREDRRSTKATLQNLATIDSIEASPYRPSQPTLRSNPKITLEEPLFTMTYFRKQEQLEKRLVTVAKKQKLDNIYKKSKEKYKFY